MNIKQRSHKLNRALPIALRLTEAERVQAHRLASDDGRSAAGFARLMYLRGLSTYLAEGRRQALACGVE